MASEHLCLPDIGDTKQRFTFLITSLACCLPVLPSCPESAIWVLGRAVPLIPPGPGLAVPLEAVSARPEQQGAGEAAWWPLPRKHQHVVLP